MSGFWNPFDDLSSAQRAQLDSFANLLLELNRRVNLISREDEERVLEHHVLHSLALTMRRFPAGSEIVDWGTGGGLPAIPLAIAYPHASFVAVDAIEKKVQAVRLMARRLGLRNLAGWHGRAELYPHLCDYSVSRATAALEHLWSWHARVARKGVDEREGWRRGLICLKGGDLSKEIEAARSCFPRLDVRSFPLANVLPGVYFEAKVILECREGDEPMGDAGS